MVKKFDMPIFPDDIVEENAAVFFYFECKECGERWMSMFCQCTRCKRVRKFRILDQSEFETQCIMDEIAKNFHYVELIGEIKK